MSYQNTIYSPANFQIQTNPRAMVSPWSVSSHYPRSICLTGASQTLTPEQTISGAFYISPPNSNAVNITLPEASSWYRFLSTRSVVGVDNISNNDIFKYDVVLGGAGTRVNFLPGTGAAGIIHAFGKPSVGMGATGALCDSFAVQWAVSPTSISYNVL